MMRAQAQHLARGAGALLLCVGFVVSGGLVVSCGGFFPTSHSKSGYWNPVCPDEMEHVVVGAHCAEASAFDGDAKKTRPICDYEAGFCACTFDDCDLGSRAGCTPRYVWTCQEDPSEASICPHGRHAPALADGDPCDSEGTICSYDVLDHEASAKSSCFATFSCKAGEYRFAGRHCLGAAGGS